MMSDAIAALSIYRKGEEPTLLLMHEAPFFDDRGSYKGNGCWGDLESVDLGRFESEGLEIVQQSLRAFATRRRRLGPTDKQGFDLWPPSKRQRFCREYADVNVSLRENGDLWLDPTKPRSLGFSGMSDEMQRVIVPVGSTPAQFFASVIEALKRCE